MQPEQPQMPAGNNMPMPAGGNMPAPSGGEPVSNPQPAPTTAPGTMAPDGMAPAGEMATPEQRQQLVDMLEGIQKSMSELQTAKFRSANEREVARVETLKEILLMMRDAGADLNDPASVGEFLQKLRSVNPSMAEIFESSLDSLLGEEAGVDAEMGGMPDAEPAMPQQPGNEALPENVRGPIPGQAGG